MSDASISSDESAIDSIVRDRVRAVREKSLDDLLSHHSPDVLSFEVVDPLQNAGFTTIRARADKWLSSYQSEIGYGVRDVRVRANGTIGYCHYLYRVHGILKAGGQVDMWVRATMCLEKRKDQWTIVHEHHSVPFDPETGKASVNLEP